jgi:hypothetical protein
LVLDRFHSNNLHIHIEEAFLSAQDFNFLSLSSKGNQILALARAKNKNSSAATWDSLIFTGNCVPHHHALPAFTSNKSKWVWRPNQNSHNYAVPLQDKSSSNTLIFPNHLTFISMHLTTNLVQSFAKINGQLSFLHKS